MRLPMRAEGLFAALLLAGCAAAPPVRGAAPAAGIRFDHLALHVADLAGSVGFYRDVFGLREIPAPVTGPRWLDAGGGVQLHLIPGRAAPVADDRSVHLALATAGLEPIMERLRARGIAWQDVAGTQGAVTRRGDGVHQIYLRDPDGYWIEVNDALK